MTSLHFPVCVLYLVRTVLETRLGFLYTRQALCLLSPAPASTVLSFLLEVALDWESLSTGDKKAMLQHGRKPERSM